MIDISWNSLYTWHGIGTSERTRLITHTSLLVKSYDAHAAYLVH